MIYTDQLNRQVDVKESPKRIVSLVPSQTRLLADLDLDDEVVGITRFCVDPPEWFAKKKRIGGTKDLHLEEIHALEPDFILANKEENAKPLIRQLAEKYPVWISDVKTLNDTRGMIIELGKIMDRAEKARKLVDSIDQAFSTLHFPDKKSVLYFIWKNPWMVAGKDTFISHMLEWAGFENIISDNRYPRLEEKDFANLHPEYVFLSSEPYPFAEKHISELKEHFPKSKICTVDGQLFSWYGSTVLRSPAYFAKLRNSDDER